MHQLAVHTVGGVISPGEPMMLIVPEGDELAVEAKVAAAGHRPAARRARRRRCASRAFNQRTTPEIEGDADRVVAPT